MQTIHPCLWFSTEAEEAMTFYTGIFRNSRVLAVQRFGKNAPMALPRLLGDSDPAVAQRVMAAMLKMSKIDIATLEAAARGDS